MTALNHPVRTDLGAASPGTAGDALLSLVHISDAHVMDTLSPARCEWIELLADDAYWRPLLHMHRPYEALTHWALAAHVQRLHRSPVAPCSGRPYDLALSTGDNIDNAQANELQAFLVCMAGGQTSLSAYGGVHEAGPELGARSWPFWCPQGDGADPWQQQGYPRVPDYVARVSATLRSPGLGFAWTSVPGNHDVMRQGTALTNPALESIALGSRKSLSGPPDLRPADPLEHFLAHPQHFSSGGVQRVIAADAGRRAIDLRAWMAAHIAHGASGLDASHVRAGCADTFVDTAHVRIILLDTNHPAGHYEGSVGAAQMEWLDARLTEVDRQAGRLAVLASHHGSVSLVNTRGDDRERLLAQGLTAVAHRHPCVVAWLVGHRHVHRVVPHRHPQGTGKGFWEITTASVIDWPSQTRAVEFIRHRDGSLEIACTLQDHQAAPGSLAALHRELALRFAGPQAQQMQGQAGDGNVRLMRPA